VSDPAIGALAGEIRFRLIGPEDGPRQLLWWQRFEFRIRRAGLSLEPVNTVLLVQLHGAGRNVRSLLSTPRMSTLAIGALVNHAVARLRPQDSYVNVGVWHGFTVLAGAAGNGDKHVIGIDNFSQFGGPRDSFLARWTAIRDQKRHRFVDDDFERYLERHTGPIGVYYYDGAHDYESQYRGLVAAEPYFADRVVIFVDDWNQTAAREATRRFVNERSDYSITFERHTATNQHPTFWNGLAIVERGVG
jgi:hypothetical protein